MVGSRSSDIQCHSTGDTPTRADNRIRCLLSGLGGNSEGPGIDKRGIVVSERAGQANQLPGIVSCNFRSKSIYQESTECHNPSEDRQYTNQGLHQPLWGDTFTPHECIGNRSMEMVHRETDFPGSRAPTRSEQSHCRHRVQNGEGQVRLDDSSSSVLPDQQEVWPARGGPICISADPPTGSLLQLEAGSSSRGNGCFHPELEPVSGLCQSSMVPAVANTGEDSEREGQGGGSGTIVEDSALVSSPSTSPDRDSTSYSNSGEYSDITNPAGVHHASWSSSTSRLAIVRNQWRSGGLSEEASRLLASSWRNKTKSTYESLFKRWDSWCQERNRDPIRGPIADIMNFLAGLFEQGYQYRSVNSYRSAISSVHEKVDGEEVGKHPLVSRMMKGIFNERPPQPKYDSMWNVEAVLRWFKEEGPTDSLSLQDLTIKTTMLLALTRPCRGADLAELDLNHRSFLPEGVLFTPVHLSKQSCPSHNRVKFFFPAFKDNKNLCPVETLKVYERKTFTFRNSSGRNHLLRSFIGKHGPVTSSTVARWIITCLHKAGIDTSKFQAHSVRAAATSTAAMSGLTVEDILKAADWSSEGVFQKFYYQLKYSGEFGSRVLAARSSKSHVDMETEPSEV